MFPLSFAQLRGSSCKKMKWLTLYKNYFIRKRVEISWEYLLKIRFQRWIPCLHFAISSSSAMLADCYLFVLTRIIQSPLLKWMRLRGKCVLIHPSLKLLAIVFFPPSSFLFSMIVCYLLLNLRISPIYPCFHPSVRQHDWPVRGDTAYLEYIIHDALQFRVFYQNVRLRATGNLLGRNMRMILVSARD